MLESLSFSRTGYRARRSSPTDQHGMDIGMGGIDPTNGSSTAAANWQFVLRNNAAPAKPKLAEAPVKDAPETQAAPNPSVPKAIDVAKKQAQQKTTEQQQQLIAQQRAALGQDANGVSRPNAFVSAFVNDNKFKNGLSEKLYAKTSQKSGKPSVPGGLGTSNFGMMSDFLNQQDGPSEAIERFGVRMNFFDDPNTQASLS